jgi:23S rRNA (uracil747-C5)-methyltransferase
MKCDNFTSERCRSCELLSVSVAEQAAIKLRRLSTLLAPLPHVPAFESLVEPAVVAGSRSKAKLAVGGSLSDPLIGLVDAAGMVTELLDCPLHHPQLNEIAVWIKQHIMPFKLEPYNVTRQTGELKYLIMRVFNQGEQVLVRFVLRSTESIPRLKKMMPPLLAAFPNVALVTANLQPKAAAVLEGEQEILLTDCADMLWERYNHIELAFGPQSFSQVTPSVAAQLYARAAQILDAIKPQHVLDLFCGVGGFGLHVGSLGYSGLGVEVSADAVVCARAAAAKNGIAGWDFHVADVLRGLDVLHNTSFDAVIVNPPRRGIGERVIHYLQEQKPTNILYSSCNPVTLVSDMQRLVGLYRLERLIPFDMFPGTSHLETLAVLTRQ